jgi:hypothetical protein
LAALAYSIAPFAIVVNPVPPFTAGFAPVTVPVKSIVFKNPEVALLHSLRSIPASKAVNTILLVVVATVSTQYPHFLYL